ncbi:MAG: nucleotidyltransferase family protein [Thiolinea sp.]
MNSATSELAGVLLAAGKGSRFGGDKGLALLPDGVPMALRSALNLRAAVSDVICVVRPEDRALSDLFAAYGFDVVTAYDAELGMSASLQAGVLAAGDASGWILALADMPLIELATYQCLVAEFMVARKITVPCLKPAAISATNAAVAAKDKDIVEEVVYGHPVIFPSRFRQELLALRGDRGAKKVLHQNKEQIHQVFVDDPGVLRDFDTPAALQRLFI